MDNTDSEASPLLEAETDLITQEADDPPPNPGNPSTPHTKTSQAKDEADQDRSSPPTKRDPYKNEVTPGTYPPPPSLSTAPNPPTVHEYPNGYPQLAAFAACDPNFAIYRQFRNIRHRCLLATRDELRALEHDLAQLDLHDHLTNPQSLSCRSRDARQDPPRRTELLARIKAKMVEYGTSSRSRFRVLAIVDINTLNAFADHMLRSTRDLMHWPRPTERNRRAYVNYITNTQPTVERESRFIRRGDDLVTLAGDLQNSWLEGQIGGLLDQTCPRLTAASTPQHNPMLVQSTQQPERHNAY